VYQVGINKGIIGRIIKNTPDALGSAADLFHRVQHRFADFNFNCLYVDCTTEWSVFIVNWSIITVIRLLNDYKQK